MVYSTCSILKEENEDKIQEFLNENKDWEIGRDIQGKKMEKWILPNENQDGFYICKLRRK